MAKKEIKTIDCTPTWQWCASVYIMSIAHHGDSEESKPAREGIMQMADIAEHYAQKIKGGFEFVSSAELAELRAFAAGTKIPFPKVKGDKR